MSRLVCFALFCAGGRGALAAPSPRGSGRIASPRGSGQITCFGDSWAAFACDALADVAKLHFKKNKVVNKGVPGSTASEWAVNPNAMIADIASGGVPEFVWLSIGGNDILDGWGTGVCSGNATSPAALACYEQILNDTSIMLDALFKLDPVLQVVHFGYDFPNFVSSPTCVAYAAKVFHGDTSTERINERFLGFETNVLQPLASKYPTFRYAHPQLWGTLQQHGAQVGEPVPPPYPNAAFPSPAALMNDGCIHASKAGWGILMNALWDAYFAKRT